VPATGLVLAATAAIVALALSPKPSLLDDLTFSKRVYDRHGELLRVTLSEDDKYRVFVPIKKVAPVMVEATLLQEDRYFYRHCGVNPVALAKAAWNAATGYGKRFGASTITMQLARSRWQLNTRTWRGKFIQIARAMQLEWHYSKSEILEAYLNRVSYGQNIEGVGAASLVYFGKMPGELTLAEALTLGVIPQSPRRHAPKDAPTDEAVTAARGRLLSAWTQCHPEAAGEESLLGMGLRLRGVKDLPFRTPHLVEDVLKPRTESMEVRTTLDLRIQDLVERTVSQYVAARRRDGIENAAVLLVETSSMEVLAAVGSADYFDADIDGQVNGTRARRSPGSALKPFIYALAMEQGLIHPLSILRDTPCDFGAYRPENFDRHFSGPVSARDALIQSRNIPAVSLASHLSGRSFHEFLRQAGVDDLRDESEYGLSIALGAAEVTMEELVQMYGVLANGGELKPVRKLLTSGPEPPRVRLIAPETCFLVKDMLRDCPRPQGIVAAGRKDDGPAVWWKTGTSFSYRDAWCIGVFDRYVLAVWVGNFDGRSNPSFVGRAAAAPLFFRLVDSLRTVFPARPSGERETRADLNVKRVPICPDSGCLRGDRCPQVVQGWFIPGVSPIAVCGMHREQPLPAGAGRPPQIWSPGKGAVYHLRVGGGPDQSIPLEAVTETGSGKIYWFADKEFLGTAEPGRALFWRAEPGAHTIHVVDERGRGDSRNVSVALGE